MGDYKQAFACIGVLENLIIGTCILIPRQIDFYSLYMDKWALHTAP